MDKEIWIPIKETNNTYSVSNHGQVKRIKDSHRKGFSKIGKILTPANDGCGYYFCYLFFDGNKIMRKIHKLVCEQFIGPLQNGKNINHKDGNKSNNHVNNLEYITLSENQMHARYVLGKFRRRHILFTEDVVKIINRSKLGETATNIHKDYSHISISAIYRIIKRQTWKHIKLA